MSPASKASPSTTLDITLLGRDYRVACPLDERESLQRAVDFLSARMGELATKTKSTGERLAVMTALNLAHELLTTKQAAQAGETPPDVPNCATIGAESSAFDEQEFARRIDSIAARLDAAMAEQEKLF